MGAIPAADEECRLSEYCVADSAECCVYLLKTNTDKGGLTALVYR